MTVELTLPIAASPSTAAANEHAQWRIESLQMVNWGGFHGPHEVRLHHGSTLMSGASGSGKSTVLDAYIALMMPSDTPFNGASNDAAGRARSSEQRNLLTYLRGKMDSAHIDGSDELRDHVLRGGNGEHIWGALAATFLNDNGRRFTVLRIYFVKAGSTTGGDVVTSYATFDGHLDVARLEPLAATRFDKRSLRSIGLLPFNTFREFEDALHTRLGIGGGDGGRKAMRLLARVQAGMEVKRVDTLYKSMVLEQPITFEKADDAIKHFANLDASYDKMLDEADKVKALQRLPDLQHELAQAESTAALIEAFGIDREGPTPFQLWRLRTERELLDEAVAANRSEHATTKTRFEQAKDDEQRHADRLKQIAQEKRANGGDAIDARKREIDGLTGRQDAVYAANLKFQASTEAISLIVPETPQEFGQAQADAAEFLAGFDARASDLRAQEDAIRDDDLSPLTTKKRELLEEKGSLVGRAGMVPRRLHESRVKMAQSVGLDPMIDLPFVAELIDVLPDQERWRKAVETTLGGIARTVLVDRRVRQRLSAAIDPLKITPRIRFQGVDLAAHEEFPCDEDYVSGKLAFKESPFSRWVQDRVTAHGTDHRCVQNASQLDDREPMVTLTGQTRDGDKGAHGESHDGNIIGFSNERRLTDIDAELDALEPAIRAVRARIDRLRARSASLQSQKEAHTYVANTSWADIDHLGLARRVEELKVEIAKLRAANSILDALQAEEEKTTLLHKEANRIKVLDEDRLAVLAKQHGDLASEQDAVLDAIDAIDDAQSAHVTEEQGTYLDELFAANWDVTSLGSFHANMRAMSKRLREESATARQSRDRTVRAMESMFEQYKARWTENNLGTSIASADGYREILDRIQTGGLHERRNKWRLEFAKWSSNDLLTLNEAFDTAMEDIEDRLVPINAILATLPFGGKGHLQIKHRRMITEDVSRFKRDLRKLSSGVALELTDAEVEARFKRLREFMTKISVPPGHTKKSTSMRDGYLDVRQHVVINAVCVDEHSNELATYDSLGGKSGGETQELVAFIVGAALRYQLGDESRSRPRFAPVFLDEGFIKSDSEFAGRALTAWQNLGFQLIIGAPLGQVTALEPHMDLLLTVTKSLKGYSFVRELSDAQQQGSS